MGDVRAGDVYAHGFDVVDVVAVSDGVVRWRARRSGAREQRSTVAAFAVWVAGARRVIERT